MNRLSVADRAQVLAALCEGNSIRGTTRMTGTAKGTILRLLRDVGGACWLFQDIALRNLRCERLELDEIWSFCHAKERNLPRELRGTQGVGDMWTWTAIDPDTKLIVTWHLGKRTTDDAQLFLNDLSERVVSERVQITTDGWGAYNKAIQRLFHHRADHGIEVKTFASDVLVAERDPDRKYSAMEVYAVTRTPLYGVPDPEHISTAHVERQNLTMRMSMRRFTRLTNGFSKKAENLAYALALHFMYYNFCRKHQTLKTTPAIAAGLTKRIYTVHDLARLPDEMDVMAA